MWKIDRHIDREYISGSKRSEYGITTVLRKKKVK
jgi:hypothetical protein